MVRGGVRRVIDGVYKSGGGGEFLTTAITTGMLITLFAYPQPK